MSSTYASPVPPRSPSRVPFQADLEEFYINVPPEELATWSLRELKIACAARRLDTSGRKVDLLDRLMQRSHMEAKRRMRKQLEADVADLRENEADGFVYCFGLGYNGFNVRNQRISDTWDRLRVRNNGCGIQALAGIGVVTVELVRGSACVGGVCRVLPVTPAPRCVQGFDSTVCYALCNNGEIWSWGILESNQRGPVGYKRQLHYTAAVRRGLPRVVQNDCWFVTTSFPQPHPPPPPNSHHRVPQSKEEFPTVQMARFTKSKVGSTPAGVPAIPFRQPVRPKVSVRKAPVRFKKVRAADGVPAEQPWVTEDSVARADEVRKSEAEASRRARLRKRRERRARMARAGYDMSSDSDDFGESDHSHDGGFGEAVVSSRRAGSARGGGKGKVRARQQWVWEYECFLWLDAAHVVLCRGASTTV